MQTGLVEVIIGSMFSGKTTELLRRVRRAEIAKQKVLLFKARFDNRYAEYDIVSHDGASSYSIPIQDPLTILKIVNEEGAQVVAIDEAQFLPETLTAVVDELARRDIRVIVCGLDTDFQGQPWPTMVPLVFRAEKLKKLQAICVQCGEDACRNQRLQDGVEITRGDLFEVGGTGAYEARCRSCFVEESDTLEVDNNIHRREANF